MKTLLALAAAVVAAPLAAAHPVVPLAGVANGETTIDSTIVDAQRGHGDVMFVRDQTNRWYRVALNEGCLSIPLDFEQIVFRRDAGLINRFTFVDFPRDFRSCHITSIRHSAPPPQVDRRSIVTLD
jgi:hypothetical protein